MKAKTSKAQLEVWEMKERVYNEIKDLSPGKRVDYILKKTAKRVAELKKRKRAAA